MGSDFHRGELSKRSRERRRQKLAKRGERFIKGPVPYEWCSRAANVSKVAGCLAWVIWYRRGLEGRETELKLCRSDFAPFNICRASVHRALVAMERAGLVRVARKRGACPRVSIIRPNETGTSKSSICE